MTDRTGLTSNYYNFDVLHVHLLTNLSILNCGTSESFYGRSTRFVDLILSRVASDLSRKKLTLWRLGDGAVVFRKRTKQCDSCLLASSARMTKLAELFGGKKSVADLVGL